jgi:hypothetical protein
MAGTLIGPPPTRATDEQEMSKARATLSQAGCDLQGLSVENLHVSSIDMEASILFEILTRWEHWPTSSFYPCINRPGEKALAQISYRWYHGLRIVAMRVEATKKPEYIIHRITGGIGAGGYHSFLLKPVPGSGGHSETSLSIYTAMPRRYRRLFPEGLHDWMNYDIYAGLQRRTLAPRGPSPPPTLA